MSVIDEPMSRFVESLAELAAGGGRPMFVGLDGRSGVGKSTLAAAAAARLIAVGTDVVVIEGDQFYAGGSSATWDRRSADDKVAHVLDWRRQHQALTDLRRTGVTRWHPFNWDGPDWDADDARLSSEVIEAAVAPIVLLEGAYSCRPELHDVLDHLVMLQTPTDVRRRQLLVRDGADYREDWEARWSAAEDLYFGTIMTPGRFDLILGSR